MRLASKASTLIHTHTHTHTHTHMRFELSNLMHVPVALIKKKMSGGHPVARGRVAPGRLLSAAR